MDIIFVISSGGEGRGGADFRCALYNYNLALYLQNVLQLFSIVFLIFKCQFSKKKKQKVHEF